MESTKQYRGHTVTLQENWECTVSGPEFDEDKYRITFQSFKAVRDEIDRRVEDAAKYAASEAKLGIIVLDHLGQPVRIERIHRGNGNIAGVQGRYIWPNVGWIREALQRASQLRSELKTIDEGLFKIRLETDRHYGRIEADQYPGTVKKLLDELARKTEQAKEMQQPQEAPSEATA